jgi:two-component system CheB/CheR fusion protein
MLISILHNLVSNAIKHSTLEGIISISAIQNDKEVVVEIKDNGLGMSKEIKNNLFSPQIKSLLKGVEENKGAGIGLLLVNGFIEKIGGRIWVESQEGSGTSFFFTLPMENGDNMKPQIANKE